MKKFILLSLLIVSAFSVEAKNQFTATSNLPKGKISSDLAYVGAKYGAIKNALKACEKSAKSCGIVSVEIVKNKAFAVVTPIREWKDRMPFTVDSGEYGSVTILNQAEIDGIIMRTIEAGLEKCKAYTTDTCVLEEVFFKEQNTPYFDDSLNQEAFKTVLEIRITAYGASLDDAE